MAAGLKGVRLKLAPEPGDKRAQWRTCPNCGERHLQWRTLTQDHCPDCAEDRLKNATSDLSHREGPFYERAVAGQLRHWLAEATRLGIPIDPPDNKTPG